MSTSLPFVELLIAGLHGMLWIFTLMLTFVGIDWLTLQVMQELIKFDIILTGIAFSVAYVLGIVIDRIAAFIFSKANDRIIEKTIPNLTSPVSAIRFAIGKEYDSLNNVLEYTRSRMRILRSATLNFVLMTVSVCMMLIIRLHNPLAALLTLIAGFILSSVTVWIWRDVAITYHRLIKNHLLELKHPNQNNDTSRLGI